MPEVKPVPCGKAKIRAQAAWLLLHTTKRSRSHRGVLGPRGSGGAGVHTQVPVTPSISPALPVDTGVERAPTPPLAFDGHP